METLVDTLKQQVKGSHDDVETTANNASVSVGVDDVNGRPAAAAADGVISQEQANKPQQKEDGSGNDDEENGISVVRTEKEKENGNEGEGQERQGDDGDKSILTPIPEVTFDQTNLDALVSIGMEFRKTLTEEDIQQRKLVQEVFADDQEEKDKLLAAIIEIFTEVDREKKLRLERKEFGSFCHKLARLQTDKGIKTVNVTEELVDQAFPHFDAFNPYAPGVSLNDFMKVLQRVKVALGPF